MADETKKKPVPGAGRKGGTRFPQLELRRAIEFAKKLVAKTHNGPQPANIILGGVIGSLSSTGEVKLSALKQFGLLQGESTAYEATPLAKQIAAAPDEELPALLQQACLTPPLFKTLYDTFQGDQVSTAKVKQQAMHHRVHIDLADRCVEMFVAALECAGLGNRNGDQITLAAARTASVSSANGDIPAMTPEPDLENPNAEFADGTEETATPALPPPPVPLATAIPPSPNGDAKRQGAFQVTINIDPTMDPEKLERHLKVLRSYGIC